MHTCRSYNTVYTLNTCYKGAVESIGGDILEQSESVRAVQKLIVGRRERQSNFLVKPRPRLEYKLPDNVKNYK